MAARYATDTFVVQLTLTAPSGLGVTAVGSGGTFAAATYFWKITGTNAFGETTASNEATVAIALNGSANLSWSALPSGTTGVKVYRGTATNAENVLVATLGAVTAYTDTGGAGTGASPPAANSALTASHVVQRGSLRDSASVVVTAVPAKFTTTPPVAGTDVDGKTSGRLAVYPAGTEF